jgi:NAD(P)-dependent dehydrogenase (short-subunit alcohol dehydrogenase family)
MSRFTGKYILVTGGASGIGAAIVRRLAGEGGAVWIVDRDAEGATALAGEILREGGQATAGLADVTDLAALREIFAALPRVDVLVNCAGIAQVGTIEQTAPEDLDRLYAVNVKGVFHTMHLAVARMRRQGGGVILNLASVAARLGVSERFAYSMTKGAVLAMTLSVAKDFVRAGIRCNCLCPARIHTPFVDGYLAQHYPGRQAEMLERLAAYQPLGRMGTPAEVAALAAFLCSDEAGFITGAAFDIDGGVMTLR